MKIKLMITILVSLFSVVVFAQDASEARKKHFNLEKGIAIDGYDPVGYIKKGKAIKGNKSFAVFHQGATYYFSSAENKAAFLQNPAAYEPQYGGWCAYAMGNSGEKVSVDPETFKILNGKLFLFYNSFFNNTLKSWNKDESKLKAKADINWQKTFN